MLWSGQSLHSRADIGPWARLRLAPPLECSPQCIPTARWPASCLFLPRSWHGDPPPSAASCIGFSPQPAQPRCRSAAVIPYWPAWAANAGKPSCSKVQMSRSDRLSHWPKHGTSVRPRPQRPDPKQFDTPPWRAAWALVCGSATVERGRHTRPFGSIRFSGCLWLQGTPPTQSAQCSPAPRSNMIAWPAAGSRWPPGPRRPRHLLQKILQNDPRNITAAHRLTPAVVSPLLAGHCEIPGRGK